MNECLATYIGNEQDVDRRVRYAAVMPFVKDMIPPTKVLHTSKLSKTEEQES